MAFEFFWPWMSLLLLLPALARLLWVRVPAQSESSRHEYHQSVLHPSLANLKSSFHGTRPRIPVTNLFFKILPFLIWILLTAAMMRPQWLEPYAETFTPGYDLMLSVDASHSMEALDFTVGGQRVTRMAVLKGVMDEFIENRVGDRIGLIIFGERAYTISPLTYDLNAVRQQLADVSPNIAGPGTAMGDSIALGVKKLRERPPGSRILLLVADGVNTSGSIRPIDAARLAAREGVRIYTIGVGSEDKAVQIMEHGKLIVRDDLGLDETVLREIAEIANGAYFRASNTHALEEIYSRIDQLEKSQAESRTVMLPHPLFQWPLGAALILMLVHGLFPEGRMRSLSRRYNG